MLIPEAVLDAFAGEVSGLGRKLSVMLVQLPPSLQFDEAVAEHFFAALRERVTPAVACEPRHRSWFTPEVDGWLKTRRIARVAADPAFVPEAAMPGGWHGLTYLRLHGSPRMYWSAYDAAFLETVARQLAETKSAAWCVLDNTARGHALGDALKLMERLKKGP